MNSARLPSEMESECRADSLVPMRFAIFPLHLSKVLRLPRNIDARSCEVLHLSRKITLANLQIWCSKMQPLSGNQRPWPPNISDEHVFCTAPAMRNASLKILFECPTPAIAFGNATKPSRFAHFWQGAQSLAPATRKHIWTSKSAPYPWVFLHFWLRNVLPTTACTFLTSQLPKVVRTWCFLYILTWKCASRHNGVHFFDFSTSKSGSGNGVFCTFWLRHVLRATTACNFSSLIWPDGSAPAALASLVFDPPELQNIGKNTVFRDFPTFSRTYIFFLLTLSLLWSSLFYSSLLSDSFHLCFSCVHIVESLTSKLPSIIVITWSISWWFLLIILEFKFLFQLLSSLQFHYCWHHLWDLENMAGLLGNCVGSSADAGHRLAIWNGEPRGD